MKSTALTFFHAVERYWCYCKKKRIESRVIFGDRFTSLEGEDNLACLTIGVGECVVFITGRGGAGFAHGGPAVTQARGPIFLVLPALPSSRAQPHSLPERALIFHHQNLRGPVWGMGGMGHWPGVGAVEGEKYTPPGAGELAGAGNFTGGPGFSGPWRPRNEH